MSNIIKTFKHNTVYWKGQIEPANTHNKDRSSSWLELFVDLVFVAGLGVLVHGLIENYSIYGLLISISYFLLIWDSWNSITMYSHFFEQRGILHRCIVLVNVISSALILIPYSPHYELAIHDYKLSLTFAMSIFISRLIMMLTWRNAYKKTYNKYLKKNIKVRWNVYRVSIVLIVAGMILIFFNPLYLQGLLLLLVLNETFFSLFFKESSITKHNAKFFNIEHLVERFGLFTMLVIGESIVAIISNIQSQTVNVCKIVVLILLFLFVFLLWFLYYELIMNKAIANLKLWKYAHLCLHFSFILIAVGINLNLEEGIVNATLFNYPFNNVLLYAVICYYISLMFMKKTLKLSQTLGEDLENLDETKIQKAMDYANIITIIIIVVLIIFNINNLIAVLLILNALIIINIGIYYYYYIKLMNNIMW